MKTRQEIELNYHQAIAQATKIEEIANQIRIMKDNKMGNAVEILSTGWKGECATSYLRKMESTGSGIEDCEKRLLRIASGVREAAERMYNLEMALLTILQKRDY